MSRPQRARQACCARTHSDPVELVIHVSSFQKNSCPSPRWAMRVTKRLSVYRRTTKELSCRANRRRQLSNENSKLEIRNSKQIQMTKKRKIRNERSPMFG